MLYPFIPWKERELNWTGGHLIIDDAMLPAESVIKFPDLKGPPHQGDGNNVERLKKEEISSVAFFLNWILYSYQGRKVCRQYKAGRSGLDWNGNKFQRNIHDSFMDEGVERPYFDDDTIRNGLRVEFEKILGNGQDAKPVVDAALECHIAAGHFTRWKEEYNFWYEQGPLENQARLAICEKEMAKYTAAYQAFLFTITTALWDGFMNREFDLAW